MTSQNLVQKYAVFRKALRDSSLEVHQLDINKLHEMMHAADLPTVYDDRDTRVQDILSISAEAGKLHYSMLSKCVYGLQTLSIMTGYTDNPEFTGPTGACWSRHLAEIAFAILTELDSLRLKAAIKQIDTGIELRRINTELSKHQKFVALTDIELDEVASKVHSYIIMDNDSDGLLSSICTNSNLDMFVRNTVYCAMFKGSAAQDVSLSETDTLDSLMERFVEADQTSPGEWPTPATGLVVACLANTLAIALASYIADVRQALASATSSKLAVFNTQTV